MDALVASACHGVVLSKIPKGLPQAVPGFTKPHTIVILMEDKSLQQVEGTRLIDRIYSMDRGGGETIEVLGQEKQA